MNSLKVLKRLCTTISYNIPPRKQCSTRKLLVFADAGRHCECGQLALLQDSCSKTWLKVAVTTSSIGRHTAQIFQCVPPPQLKFSQPARQSIMKKCCSYPVTYIGTQIPLLIVVDSKHDFSRYRSSEIVLNGLFLLMSVLFATTLNVASFLR